MTFLLTKLLSSLLIYTNIMVTYGLKHCDDMETFLISLFKFSFNIPGQHTQPSAHIYPSYSTHSLAVSFSSNVLYVPLLQVSISPYTFFLNLPASQQYLRDSNNSPWPKYITHTIFKDTSYQNRVTNGKARTYIPLTFTETITIDTHILHYPGLFYDIQCIFPWYQLMIMTVCTP